MVSANEITQAFLDSVQYQPESILQYERVYGLAGQVNLEWKDCLQLDCDGFYDAIYCRDVFLHIHDKFRLFSVLHAALHPGGRATLGSFYRGEVDSSKIKIRRHDHERQF